MFIAAQVSIYPMGQAHLSTAINQALEIFKKHGLEVDSGAMSTVISGEDETLFTATKEAFQMVAAQSGVVMVVTYSNACPV